MDMSRPKIDGVHAQIPTMVFTPSAEGDTKVIIDIGGSGAEGTMDFSETIDRDSLPSGENRGTLMPLTPVKES